MAKRSETMHELAFWLILGFAFLVVVFVLQSDAAREIDMQRFAAKAITAAIRAFV